jgi:hypothetical protein
MKRFIYTAQHGGWDIEFRYNDNGLLVLFELRDKGDIPVESHSKIVENIPLTLDELEKFKQRAKGKLTEIMEVISFNMFWEVYGKKINRKRAEPLWEKLSDADKARCFYSVKSYDNCLQRTGRYKQDPENYIKSRNFETNWNQIR